MNYLIIKCYLILLFFFHFIIADMFYIKHMIDEYEYIFRVYWTRLVSFNRGRMYIICSSGMLWLGIYYYFYIYIFFLQNL